MMGVTVGEITARGADVGHEQRVADKRDVLVAICDEIGHVRRRVARDVPGLGPQVADLEDFVGWKQVVELRGIEAEFRLEVEDRAEGALYQADLLADGDASARLLAPVGSRRQEVGVRMGFQQPVDRQPLGAHEGDDAVRRDGRGAAGLGIVVEHRVDDRAVRPRGLRRRQR